jgi:glycosyltransferase 2 family protein
MSRLRGPTSRRQCPSTIRGPADPDVRFVVGLVGLALSGLAVRDHSIGPREAAAFRAVNRLPDLLFPPLWVVMQAGTAGAGPVAAAVACVFERPRLAARLALGGVGSWALSKVIKRLYRRPRPNALLNQTRTRGKDATGLGYVSGHAGVAVALGVAAYPELGRAAALPPSSPYLQSACAAYTSAPTSRSTSSAVLPWDLL